MTNPLRRLFDPGDWIAMKPALDPAASIISLDFTPSRGEIQLRLIVGTVVLAIAATVIHFFGDGDILTLVMGGFGFFALVNLVLGLIQSRFTMQMTMTGDSVHVRTRSLFRNNAWQERIANYRGVLLREAHVRDQGVGNIPSTKTYQVIELLHDDPARTLPLHVSEDVSPPSDIHQAFADRFGLPALLPDSGDLIATGADSDPRTGDGGAVPAPASDPGRPPAGIRLRDRGGVTRITVGGGLAVAVSRFLMIFGVPATFGWIVWNIEPEVAPYIFGAILALMLLVFGVGALLNRRDDQSDRGIEIDGETVRVIVPDMKRSALAEATLEQFQRVAGAADAEPAHPVREMALGSVRRIRVDSYTAHRSRDRGGGTVHPRLLIEGDGERMALIGSQFDNRKLEWIRDFLRHRLNR
ncbi:hypothetical protein [Oceanibacterium hippocampi]|uniref:Uncharacterized protein n=1 Tax=Oceanibacterium hippocampi TaxID=745714 RepID=A0A1Y5RBC0_9PROT|nr:hypothetical protein [Oceanibacterium hippocampi]SLN12660.1 hypothetical protein OCH7691_00184 [Oceanibacterium hippocampi]